MHKENKCIKKIIQIIQQNYTLKPENPVYQYCTTVNGVFYDQLV